MNCRAPTKDRLNSMYKSSTRKKDRNSVNLSNAPGVLRELDKADSKDSITAFIKLAWFILEPGRQFTPGWHIDAIADHLQAVTEGHLTRLIINVPPGCMKSLLTSVFWPAWEWGPRNQPHLRYVSFSYSEDLTTRDNLKTMQLIQHPWYQERWPHVQISKDQKAKHRFNTTATGFKVATSIGGLGTGERGDRIVIDDPHNVRQAESDAVRNSTITTIRESLSSRTNHATDSAIIVIMQRVHEYDATAFLLSQEFGYTHLCLPMEYDPTRHCRTVIVPSTTQFQLETKTQIKTKPKVFSDPRTTEGELLWPEGKPRHTVERDKLIMGEYATAAQFQQLPAPRGGGMIKDEWLTPITEFDPRLSRIVKTVRAWDLAASPTGDYTVGTLMSLTRENEILIRDVKRTRLTPAERDQLILTTAESDGHLTTIRLPQDPGQAGVSQKADLARKLMGYTFKFVRETGDKELRLRPFASQAEAGAVYIVIGTWNGELRNELTKFPYSRYDDQADSISAAFDELIPRRRVHRLPQLPKLISLRG